MATTNEQIVAEAIRRLSELSAIANHAVAHKQADDTIMQFLWDMGYGAVAMAYERVEKRYA